MGLTRREAVRTAAAAALTTLVPAAAQARRIPKPKPLPLTGLVGDGRFPQGVLSGDPTPGGATVLTLLDRVAGHGNVRLEVAEDPGFRRVVATRDVPTSAAGGWSVKARLTGLEPHTRYWYRFETRRSHSPVGRLQTALPPDSRGPVRFAAFSCAEYTHGWYNAYAAMAREDVDFVVCLGDYIYAETGKINNQGVTVRQDPTGIHNPHQPNILREAETLGAYRDKYALYRSDPALREMHALFPMVAVWDDHELENNYAGGAEDGGLILRDRYTFARRDAAYQAWFEAMPVVPRSSTRIYRSLAFGRNLELVLLDERRYRANQPCGDHIVPACDTWDAPRTMLGARQLSFVRSRLRRSEATWKAIGSPTMAMPMLYAGGVFHKFDTWQGYPREREALLAAVAAARGTVFVSGDAHSFFAGDVRAQMGLGPPVAPEFVTGSITSQGYGEQVVDFGEGVVLQGNDAAPATPQAVLDAVKGFNPWFAQLDLDHHGYLAITVTRDAFDVHMRRLATIKRRGDTTLLPGSGYRWSVAPGERSLLS
jgi:alkaline phosphatase D